MNRGSANETVRRADAAFVALRRAILDGALKPGARLQAEVIASGLGTSRTLAREALFRLEGVGLVEIRPKRGAIVAQPSLTEAQDVFEVRRCLEARSVARVCQRWSDELEAELKNHLSEEETAAKNDNLDNSIHLAESFHIRLARLCGNDALAQYIDEVVGRCSLILALYGSPHSTECSVSEHHMILDALKRRDQAAAVQIMDSHLAALQDRVVTNSHPSAKITLDQVISRYAGQRAESEATT